MSCGYLSHLIWPLLSCLHNAAVGVMQATEDGHGADRSLASRQRPPASNGCGDSLAAALVGLVVADVSGVLFLRTRVGWRATIRSVTPCLQRWPRRLLGASPRARLATARRVAATARWHCTQSLPPSLPLATRVWDRGVAPSSPTS